MAQKKRKRKKKKGLKPLFFAVPVLLVLLIVLLLVNFQKLKNFFYPEPDTTEIDFETKSVFDAIIHTKRLLGVSDKNFKHFVGENAIYITLNLDPEIDLNYANMILSGQVEMQQATILSGEEKGKRQIIRLKDEINSQLYQVTLQYAKVSKKVQQKTQLAIIVDDFGMHNDELVDKFCSLDKNITFAILPDQKFSVHIMQKAAETGHETLIHVPMEPVSYPKNNPGTNAIFVHHSEKEIRRRMEKFIRQLPLCIGANNHMGSLATTDEAVMKVILSVIKDNDLIFIDSRTSTSSIAFDLAKQMIIPTFESSLFLDTPDITDQVMNKKISQLIEMAKYRDKILVITHCATEERFRFLQKFIRKIESQNFELIPVSRLVSSNLPEIP